MQLSQPGRWANWQGLQSDGDKTLNMVLPPGRGQVIFRLSDVEVVSQLIEGSFPDYEQIIPRRCETRAVLSTASFLKACKQAEIFAREGSHIARFNITPGAIFKPGIVEISGQSEETGSNQNIVDASIEGPPLLIAFNVRFLREVLDVIKTPNVALETTADTLPGVIRPVGARDGQDEFCSCDHANAPGKLKICRPIDALMCECSYDLASGTFRPHTAHISFPSPISNPQYPNSGPNATRAFSARGDHAPGI